MMHTALHPNKNTLLGVLPDYLTEYLTNNTEEIRFRRNRPVIFFEHNRELLTPYRLQGPEMEELVDRLTEGSFSSYFDSIKEGYITLKGGHRVGVSGTAVYEGNKLIYLKDISSVNIRIAREVTHSADRLFQTVGHFSPLPGILIVSPPGYGKTTLLRDFIRQLSEKRAGMRISVVDERGEIAGTYQGDMQNNLGNRCDILNGYTKEDGIRMAIRSLSPNVIAVDEIGTAKDEESLIYAHHAGVSVVATIHGNESKNFRKNIQKLTEEKVFAYEVYLSKNCSSDRILQIKRIDGD